MSKKTVEIVDITDYFTIEEWKGKYEIVRWEYEAWGSDKNKGSIGETSDLADALTLIRSYTGREIKRIS
jgi:hypothetical protein